MPAIPVHHVPVVDVPWDGPGNEAKIPNDAGRQVLRHMYAWFDSGKDANTKQAYKLSHHEVTDGQPAAANINGVRNALSRIPQMRPRLSAEDEAAVKAHLQAHVDDFNSANATADTSPLQDLPTEGARALFGEALELRSADDGSLGTLAGSLAVFNQWTEIDSAIEGHFFECVAPGAFKKTFQEGANRIRCIFHHGNDPAVGLRVLGPITVLEERADDAYAEVPLLDTSYNRDLAPGIRAGLYGMSFRFRVLRQRFDRFPKKSERNPKGLPERTLQELAIPEFGPTPFAAYAGATAGMRSATDEFLAERLRGSGQILVPRSVVAASELDTEEIPEEDHGSASLVMRASTAASNPGTTRAVTERLYERSMSFAVRHPWEMMPEMLAVVKSILKERSEGHWPTEEEIRERLGIRAADVLGQEQADQVSPVCVIPIIGPIIPHGDMFSNVSGMTSVDGLQQQIRAALNDTNVKSILFDVDSPGGSTSMVPELTQEIADARGQKPMVAVANTLMASAAYHLMSQVDEIYASPSAEVGSIGVYATHQDLTAAMEKLGRKVTLVASEGSPYKAELSPFVELSAEAEAELQARVDQIYGDFVQHVATGRGTTTDDVRENYGKGRVLSAAQAVAVGMADGVATFDQTLTRMLAEVGDNAPATQEPEEVPASKRSDRLHSTSARRVIIDPYTLQPKKESWRL